MELISFASLEQLDQLDPLRLGIKTKTKERSPNFTLQEERLLAQLTLKYKKILTDKTTNAVTNRKKDIIWEAITERFNKLTPHVHRKKDTLRLKYKNGKMKTKQNYPSGEIIENSIENRAIDLQNPNSNDVFRTSKNQDNESEVAIKQEKVDDIEIHNGENENSESLTISSEGSADKIHLNSGEHLPDLEKHINDQNIRLQELMTLHIEEKIQTLKAKWEMEKAAYQERLNTLKAKHEMDEAEHELRMEVLRLKKQKLQNEIEKNYITLPSNNITKSVKILPRPPKPGSVFLAINTPQS